MNVDPNDPLAINKIAASIDPSIKKHFLQLIGANSSQGTISISFSTTPPPSMSTMPSTDPVAVVEDTLNEISETPPETPAEEPTPEKEPEVELTPEEKEAQKFAKKKIAFEKKLKLPKTFHEDDPVKQKESMTPLETPERLYIWFNMMNDEVRVKFTERFGTRPAYEFIMETYLNDRVSEIKKISDFDSMEQFRAKERDYTAQLIKAKDNIELMEKAMTVLVSPPISYAQIIGFNELHLPASMMMTFSGVDNWKVFKPDVRVRLNGAGLKKYSSQAAGSDGVIKEIKGCYAVVAWDHNKRNTYEYYFGAPDSNGDITEDYLELCDVADVTPDTPKITQKMVVILVNGTAAEVFYPPFLKEDELQVGQTVKVKLGGSGGDTHQIIETTDSVEFGEVTKVDAVVDAKTIEITHIDKRRVVLSGMFEGKLKEGDRIILDKSQSVVLKNLGPEKPKKQKKRDTGVRWDDIGGHEEAKKAVREAVEYPVIHADLFDEYEKESSKGILLWGEPGCGKTMFAKATATAMCDLHEGKGEETNFVYVKGPELLNMYVGQSELNVRELFTHARNHFDKHGYKCVIMIDEADSIMAKRTGHGGALSHTIVPQFLAEMDGLDDSCAIVFLATNRPDVLDPAIIRDGRINRKIYIGRPDVSASKEIMKIYLRKTRLAPGADINELTDSAVQYMFSRESIMYEIQTARGPVAFTLGQLASGAMLAGIVDQATSTAMHRDIATRQADPTATASGVTMEDISGAVDTVRIQNLPFDHGDDLKSVMEKLGDATGYVRHSA